MQRSTLGVAIAACLGGCGSKAAPPPPTGSRIGPALVAALDVAAKSAVPWRCAASDLPALPSTTLQAGKRTWQLSDHAIATTDAGPIAIGFIADAASATPATLAALRALRSKLDVDLVVALGGMGTSQVELSATLGALSGKAPLVALPGDLEDAGALAAVLRTSTDAVDGRLVHRIDTPHGTIALLAGASAASRLVAGSEGCAHLQDDAAATIAIATGSQGLRILASTEAPRAMVDGEPTGERALTGHELDVVVHAPASGGASPGKSGGRDGDAVAVTPGSSDASVRVPPSATPPSAGVLVLEAKSWRWRTISVDPASPAKP